MNIQPGTALRDRYIFSEHIGSGGYGLVWKATDKQLNRIVAIKRLLNFSSIPATNGQLDQLIDEARKSSNLVHPNIVQIFDIVKEESDAFLIMEFIDGPSLWSIFRAKEIPTLDDAVTILSEILRGVSFAHSRGICHRDLSPMNILLTSDGTPKIADFGLAKCLNETSITSTTSQGGTGNALFMSPEQADGQPADFRSDLFMVGIIAYLLMTGRHPFADPTGLYHITELLRDSKFTPQSPHNLPRPKLSVVEDKRYREYSAAIMRLLQRECSARFSSAEEALRAIECILPMQECGNCGENIPIAFRFCGFCGEALPDESTLIPNEKDKSANGLVQMGLFFAKRKLWSDAVKSYKEAIGLDKNYQRAYALLGYALNSLGDFEEAIVFLTDGLNLPLNSDKHEVNFRYPLAFAHSHLKDYSKALEEVDRALKIDSHSPRCLHLRAKINLFLNDVSAAKKDIDTLLKASPGHLGGLKLSHDLQNALFKHDDLNIMV